MAAKWPISSTLGFLDYAYITGDGLPAYLMGTPLVQNLGLHNVTDTLGNSNEDVVNLTVTTRQAYYGREGGANHDLESFMVFSSAEFTITESELRAIAAAAMMGLRKPSAAMGMPSVL